MGEKGTVFISTPRYRTKGYVFLVVLCYVVRQITANYGILRQITSLPLTFTLNVALHFRIYNVKM